MRRRKRVPRAKSPKGTRYHHQYEADEEVKRYRRLDTGGIVCLLAARVTPDKKVIAFYG